MQLRNCILIALAFDASPDEIENAHDMIDRFYAGGENTGGVDPKYLVGAEVPATNDQGVTAHGQQVARTSLNIDADGKITGMSASTVELDKDGLPWDERIHSSNRKMTDKGVWRAKRNVSADLKNRVEAELRSTMNATASAPAAPAPTAPTPAAPSTPSAPALPAAPGGNLPPVPGAAQTDPAYTAFVQFIAQNTRSDSNPGGRLTDDWVKQVLAHYGVADGSLQNLAHNPALIPQIDGYIRQALAG